MHGNLNLFGVTLQGYEELTPAILPALPYDLALMKQGQQYQEGDRVNCISCLMGRTSTPCCCRFVDARGKLAGRGSAIYFIPGAQSAPGGACRIQPLANLPYLCPCRYRIRTIGAEPRNVPNPARGVWIRCDVRACTGNAFFPYGIEIKGGSPLWVEIGKIAKLCQPYISSVMERLRMLCMMRQRNPAPQDLPGMLMNLYGIGALLNLLTTCRSMAHDCTLHTLMLTS